MFQIIPCECGAEGMLDGRCIGCKRVRPSSQELIKTVKRLQSETVSTLDSLKKAVELERQDLEGDQ